MGRIRILPESVVNRIAAGEVVERPASVVKELLENALDARASSVEVRLEDGGRRLVEVADDGEGMDADDAVSALERHATSKLRGAEGIDAISTLGFRGEALPSIAAVSRFTLETAPGEGGGTKVEVEGGRIRGAGPSARPRGTTVGVRDLFYNTPARRRFLRAAGTEMGHVLEAATGLALSRPDVRFRLSHGGRRILDLPAAAGLLSRLSQIEGPEVIASAAALGAERAGILASGFIVRAEGTGASRGSRRLLVNGRVVRDRVLTGAVSRAMEEALPTGSSASCVLVLAVPSDRVDVNVHPAKTEVRFAEPGLIYDLVREAVASALRGARPIRTAGAASPRSEEERRRVAEAAAAYLSGRDAWGRPGGGASSPPRAAAAGAPALDPPAEDAAPSPAAAPVVLGHYRSGYILAQDGEGLILVDQHAAHERILFEEISGAGAAQAPPRQALLFPRSVTLPARLRGRLEEAAAELEALGIEAEPFGEDAIIVRAVPAALGESDPETLVLEVLAAEDEPAKPRGGIEERRQRMLATAACHAAVKVPASLTPEKMRYIVERLAACRSPLRCPHGRPTMLRWGHREIERRFGRP